MRSLTFIDPLTIIAAINGLLLIPFSIPLLAFSAIVSAAFSIISGPLLEIVFATVTMPPTTAIPFTAPTTPAAAKKPRKLARKTYLNVIVFITPFNYCLF